MFKRFAATKILSSARSFLNCILWLKTQECSECFEMNINIKRNRNLELMTHRIFSSLRYGLSYLNKMNKQSFNFIEKWCEQNFCDYNLHRKNTAAMFIPPGSVSFWLLDSLKIVYEFIFGEKTNSSKHIKRTMYSVQSTQSHTANKNKPFDIQSR